MNVTLRQLRAFLAVARFGSFTVAAEHLYTTQSALSGSIKELENALGVQLFDRSTRRVQLTEVGRELYPLVEKSWPIWTPCCTKWPRSRRSSAASCASPRRS